jgi:hypothetical protein
MFVDDEPECGEPHRTLGTLSAKASESRSGAAGRIKTNERRRLVDVKRGARMILAIYNFVMCSRW